MNSAKHIAPSVHQRRLSSRIDGSERPIATLKAFAMSRWFGDGQQRR